MLPERPAGFRSPRSGRGSSTSHRRGCAPRRRASSRREAHQDLSGLVGHGVAARARGAVRAVTPLAAPDRRAWCRGGRRCRRPRRLSVGCCAKAPAAAANSHAPSTTRRSAGRAPCARERDIGFSRSLPIGSMRPHPTRAANLTRAGADRPRRRDRRRCAKQTGGQGRPFVFPNAPTRVPSPVRAATPTLVPLPDVSRQRRKVPSGPIIDRSAKSSPANRGA